MLTTLAAGGRQAHVLRLLGDHEKITVEELGHQHEESRGAKRLHAVQQQG